MNLVFERIESHPEHACGREGRVVLLNLSFRRAVSDHPAVIPVIASGSFGGPAVLRVTEVFMDALCLGGFAPEAAAHAYRATSSYAIGYLSLELRGFFESVVGDHRRGKHDHGVYLRLSEVALHLRTWDPEREFEAGLRRLLAGLHEDLTPEPGKFWADVSEPDGAPPNPRGQATRR